MQLVIVVDSISFQSPIAQLPVSVQEHAIQRKVLLGPVVRLGAHPEHRHLGLVGVDLFELVQ